MMFMNLGIFVLGEALAGFFSRLLHLFTRQTRLLRQRPVRVLPWPGNSPDLNLIEHVLSELVRRLPKTLFRNNNELWARVRAAWLSIPNSYIFDLYKSIPFRIRAVIAAKGGHASS